MPKKALHTYFPFGKQLATRTHSSQRRTAPPRRATLLAGTVMAALVIPLANLLPSGPGSWKLVFMVAAGLDLLAALLALLVLKPLRKRHLAPTRDGEARQPAMPASP